MSELKYYKLFHRTSVLTSPEFISVVEFGNGDEVYLKSEVDALLAEKDAEIAELNDKALQYKVLDKEHCRDLNTQEKRFAEEICGLRRALWLTRANDARDSYLKWNLFANFESEEKLFTIDEYDETPGATDGQVLRTYTEWVKTWKNVERKCRAKAEEAK